jgi:hypothetical protein
MCRRSRSSRETLPASSVAYTRMELICDGKGTGPGERLPCARGIFTGDLVGRVFFFPYYTRVFNDLFVRANVYT